MFDEGEKRELLNHLALRELSPADFRSRLAAMLFDADIESMLRKTLVDRNALDVQFWLASLQSSDGELPIEVDVDVFCELLRADWHFSHEDIAFLLQRTKDPAAIECLFECAQMELPYLSYDDTRQLARKCIKGLAFIDSPAARGKLEELTSHSNTVIADYAKKELVR
jgi:hypothetical protein